MIVKAKSGRREKDLGRGILRAIEQQPSRLSC